MKLNSRILITGATGLVGKALVQALQLRDFDNVFCPRSKDLDLTQQQEVRDYFYSIRPEFIFHCAAKVGGIVANAKSPADFIYQNITIQTNVIDTARDCGVQKLLFLGSACAYSKYADCPIHEESLLNGELEPSNRAYAIAKIAGIEMCQAYRKQYGFNAIAAMPTNLYGPGDHYDLENSHVLPGMIRRLHEAKITEAKSVLLWGTGTPTREFLYSSDMAAACIFLMDHYNEGGLINVGSGEEFSLWDAAEYVKGAVGYEGRIDWDRNRPDGTPRRFLDSSKIFALGWRPRVSLPDGLALTYSDFLKGYRE